MPIDFLEETEAKPQVDFVPESGIDFIPEEQAKSDLSGVTINPYEAEKLKPGYRPMGTMGPLNPEEILSYPDILKIPAAVVEPIMSDVEAISADVLNRTGLNPSARPGVPMVNVPQIPNLTAGGRLLKVVAPDLATGIEKGIGEFVSGFSTPGQAATVPMVGGKLVQALFALQAAGATPDSLKAIADAKTAEEQGKAIAQAAANVGMAYMLGKGLVAGETAPKVLTPPPRKTPPGLPGSVLQMPKGAPMPRPEPVAAPERVSPEEAAIQSERMSQEATAAVEPAVAPPAEAAVAPPVGDPIVSAAFRKDGKIFDARDQGGVTHMEADMEAESQGVHVTDKDAGFLTKSGKFLTREEAYEYAKKTNLPIEEEPGFFPGQLHTGKIDLTTATTPPVESAPKPEKVVAAAVRINGELSTGLDHGEAITKWADKHGFDVDETFMEKHGQVDSGFLTDTGRFIDLEEASLLAGKKPGTVSHAAEIIPEPKPSPVESGTAAQPQAKLSTKQIAAKWNSVVSQLGDGLQELLTNWNDSQLSPDGSKIVGYSGRDREFSKGKEGGIYNPSKGSFFQWLESNDAFDPSKYEQSDAWAGLVNRARQAAGIEPAGRPAKPLPESKGTAEPGTVPSAKAGEGVTVLSAGTQLFHGATKPAYESITKTGKLIPGKEVRTGTREELGLIWLTPDEPIGRAYSMGLGSIESVPKSEHGGVVSISVPKNLTLIDRSKKLTQSEADAMAKYNGRRQSYDPIESGMTFNRAIGKILQNDSLELPFLPKLLKEMGYDGITYSKGKQIGIALDELPINKPKPPTEAPGEATPAASPAAAVGEVSATPGAVAPAPPPAISEATTQTKGKQTGALELPKLEKANAKADPRLSTPGITKKAKPNSLVIQLRDLESNPIREITVESSGDPITDSKIVGDTINKNATNSNVSIRESLGVSTGPNGRAIYQFAISPNGVTWVEAGKLIEARKQRVAIENPKAAPLPPLEMGTSYPYLNTIVVAIKLSPDGKRVQVRDLKRSTGKKEWVPVNKLNTARFLARADAIDRGIGAQPSPAPAAKPAETTAAPIPQGVKITVWKAERKVGDVKEGPKLGEFYTDSEQTANSLANLTGKVTKHEIALEKPLVIPAKAEGFEYYDAEELNSILKNNGVKFKFDEALDGEEVWRHVDDGGKKLVNALKKAGFDSIQFPEFLGGKEQTTTLVFDKPKSTTRESSATSKTPVVGDTQIGSSSENAGQIPQGPGARTYQPQREAQTPESFSGTSLQNAVGELERASYGFAPSDPTVTKPMATEWIRAGMTLAKDPLAGERLIAELISNPDRRVTDAEAAMLLRQKVLIENDMNRAAEQSVTATDPQAKAAAQVRFDTLSNQLLDLLNVAKSQGREWGREGRWRQMFAAEDMSLSTLITNRRASLGRELNPAEVSELKAFADRNKELVTQLEKRNAELQAERDAAEAKQIAAQAEIDAKMAKMPSGYVVKIAEEIVASWDKRADAARARLRERMARTSAGVDPTIVLDVAEIGLSHLGHVGLDFVKWADAVKRDIGDWAEPYLKAAWEKTKALADAEINARKGKATVAEVKKSIGPKTDVLAKTKAKYGRLLERGKLEKNEAGDLDYNFHWDARKIARYFWLSGIREPMALVDAVHKVFTEFVPDMTKRQVMDALSGYGKYRTLPKDAVSVGLRDVYGQLQQIGKLDDMANKVAPKKTGFERRTPSDEERRLIKQVEEAKKAGGYDITDPETQLRTAMQAAERRLTNQINDLQHEIDTRTKIVRNKTKLVFDDKLNALKARRDALKEIHDEVFKPAPLTDAQRLAIWKEKALEKIEDYKERIASKDIHPKAKPEPVRLDQEGIKIRYEMHKVHNALMDMRLKDKLAQRNKLQRIRDGTANAIRFSRALMTGGEFSGVLRQGGFLFSAHPKIAAKALGPMFKALMSEEAQFKINEEIQTRPNAPLYQRAGLDLTESGVRLSRMEENYMFRVSENLKRLWGMKHTVKFLEAFQRAYTTYLNKLRADVFDKMADTYGTDINTAKDIANFINVATGRGSTGLGRYVGPGANAILFAPRFTISRFQLLLGQPILRASKGNRAMIAKEYGRALSGAAVVFALGAAAGGSIEFDPRSPDFGKIRFGNTRLDPLAGLAQVTRLLAVELSGRRKNVKGQLVPIRDIGREKLKFGQPSGVDVLFNFTRNKLSPSVGTTVSFLAGKDPTGQKMDLSKTLIQLGTPITYSDVLNTMQEQGVPKGVALSVLAIFGMGIQNYDPNKKQE